MELEGAISMKMIDSYMFLVVDLAKVWKYFLFPLILQTTVKREYLAHNLF